MRRWQHSVPARVLWAILGLLCAYGFASAQVGQPNNCSGTAQNVAANITFPAAGATGPSLPTHYVTIINPSGANTLWVNATPGGVAAANAAGSFPIVPTGVAPWWQPAFAPPAHISIIAPAGATPFTCYYQ